MGVLRSSFMSLVSPDAMSLVGDEQLFSLALQIPASEGRPDTNGRNHLK
jgi:hypothetical protein